MLAHSTTAGIKPVCPYPGISPHTKRSLSRGEAERRMGLSTCHIFPQDQALRHISPESSIQTPAYVEWAAGGEFMHIRNPSGQHHKARPRIDVIPEGEEEGWEPIPYGNVYRDGEEGKELVPGRSWGRKKRGLVGRFTKANSRRMLEKVARIDRRKQPPPSAFITMTYPKEWEDNPAVWKEHLDKFKKRFERQWGKHPTFWKEEFQLRDAPHFHLLTFMPKAVAMTQAFKEWVSQAWYECVGSNDPKHLKAGTRVEPLRSWRGANSYCAKYMGKAEAAGSDHVGRRWGVWWEALLPIAMQSVMLTQAEFFAIRRALVGYLKSKGYKRHPQSRWAGMRVFLNSKFTARLIANVTGEEVGEEGMKTKLRNDGSKPVPEGVRVCDRCGKEKYPLASPWRSLDDLDGPSLVYCLPCMRAMEEERKERAHNTLAKLEAHARRGRELRPNPPAR